jgi:hypothetical protein
MHTDVTKIRRPEQGVADCMDQYITVGMTGKALGKFDLNTAQIEFAVRYETVNVVANANHLLFYTAGF